MHIPSDDFGRSQQRRRRAVVRHKDTSLPNKSLRNRRQRWRRPHRLTIEHTPVSAAARAALSRHQNLVQLRGSPRRHPFTSKILVSRCNPWDQHRAIHEALASPISWQKLKNGPTLRMPRRDYPGTPISKGGEGSFTPRLKTLSISKPCLRPAFRGRKGPTASDARPAPKFAKCCYVGGLVSQGNKFQGITE